MRPLAILNAIVFGSAAAITFGLVGVLVIFLVLLTSAGIRNIPGLVIKPLEDECDWSRSAI